MNKESFLKELREKLTALSVEEREAAMTYYEEYFSDAGEENEQAVISELGSVEKVVNGILKENNYPAIDSTVKEKDSEQSKYENENSGSNINYGTIILIILLFIVAAPVILPFFFAILGITIGLFFAGLGILIAGIAVSIVGIVMMFTSPLNGLLMLGLGLILFSIGNFGTTLMSTVFSKGIPALIRGIVRIGKLPFQKGGINI